MHPLVTCTPPSTSALIGPFANSAISRADSLTTETTATTERPALPRDWLQWPFAMSSLDELARFVIGAQHEVD